MENFRKSIVRFFLKDAGGNIAIMAALVIPVLLGLSGITMDLVQMANTKTRMQAAIDAGALAAVSALAQRGVSEDEARSIAARYLKGNSSGDVDFSSNATIEVSSKTTGLSTTFDVRIVTSYEYPVTELTAMLAGKTYPISVSGKAEGVKTDGVVEGSQIPVSIMLVLDKSASMAEPSEVASGKYMVRTPRFFRGQTIYANPGDTRYLTKLEALKLAVAKMNTILSRADPAQKYVRMGANAFSSTAEPALLPAWGVSHVTRYVNTLAASGATSPILAFQNAYMLLWNAEEDELHLQKSGKFPRKSIVYMTDGELTNPRENEFLQAYCTLVKSNGIEVFTVGYKAPPIVKKRLAACATDSAHAYEADDTPGLYSAFEEIAGEQIRSLQIYLVH